MVDKTTLLRTYVGAVVAGAVALLVLVYASSAPIRLADLSPAFWVFAALLVYGELWPIRIVYRRDSGELTATWTFAFALVLLAPLWAALSAMMAACLLGELKVRKMPLRTAFNCAQVTLSLAAGGVVMDLLGGTDQLRPGGTPGIALLAALVVASGALFVLNVVLTCTAIAIDQGAPIRSVVRHDLAPLNLTTNFLLLALAPIFVVIAERSLLLVPLLLATVLAVYRSATAALEREYEALHDTLTGLANRRFFDERVAEVLAVADRGDEPVSVMLTDLDGFKDINDTLGHQTGDRLLQALAQRLAHLEGVDTVARLGGDEFAFLLDGDGTVAEAEQVASRVLTSIETPIELDGYQLRVTGSIGIATSPAHGREVGPLMRAADVAMYQAKRSRTGYEVANIGSRPRGPGRLAILETLGEALSSGQLYVHYQPKLDLRTGRARGAEALVRWEHPTFGQIAPGEFIEMAERTELIGPLTRYVLRTAARDCAAWRSQTGEDVHVAVNLSVRNLRDRTFAGEVASILNEVGLPSHALELEITEGSYMQDPEHAALVLAELRALGVRLAIDDFGTGYSSLAHLRAMPVHEIKIDRSFLRHVNDSVEDALIVEWIVKLAHSCGLIAVAEGLEDLDTLATVTAMGCDLGQGYLISPAVDAATLVSWLTAGSCLPNPAARILDPPVRP